MGSTLYNIFSKKKNTPKQKTTKKSKYNDDMIKSYKSSLLAIEKNLYKNSQKWIVNYSEIIFVIIPLYLKITEPTKDKDLLEKGVKIITELNNNNPNRWQELYNKFQLEKSRIK